MNFAFYEKITVLLFTLIDLGNFNPISGYTVYYEDIIFLDDER